MGLDMYLTARVSSASWRENPAPSDAETAIKEAEAIIKNRVLPAALPDEDAFEAPQVIGIQARMGYWRKANHIHGWFVDNVQGGTDDCGEYPVSRDHLVELRDLCAETARIYRDTDGEGARAAEMEARLPVRSGFFFGGDEYDEWYLADTENTIAICDRAIKFLDEQYETDAEGGQSLVGVWVDFYYQSSW